MSKLKMFFLLLLVLNSCSAVEYFNENGVNYCEMPCNDVKDVNTGCSCKKEIGRTELIPDREMNKFRQIVVDAHNELRNKLARGDEPGYPEAANMHMLRYDLELEHLARCYGLSRVKDLTHEPCRTTTYCNGTSTSQTISIGKGGYEKNLNLLSYVDRIVRGFYHNYIISTLENKQMLKEDTPELKQEEGAVIFTRFIWANAVRVGCVLVNVNKIKATVLICNYASRGSSCSADTPEQPIYSFGTKCSLCDSKKCDKDLGGKYDALCREDIEYSHHLNQSSVRSLRKSPAPANNPTKEQTKNASITLNVSVFSLFLFVILVNSFK